MTINGIETAVFGVEDLQTCERFLSDFGLELSETGANYRKYTLPEGSNVILRRRDDAELPQAFAQGPGIRQVVWGVDTPEALADIKSELSRDREVVERDGTLLTVDDMGLAIGFRVFTRNPLTADVELTNSPGRSDRWNAHRKWYERAKPKLIHHVVFAYPDLQKPISFYRDRLKFRITDVARDRGVFLRAEGRSDHHNIFWMKADQPRFVHISFGVENIDELLAGANNMQRAGWKSKLGLGRHRISSTLYFYIESPTGGEAEYSADTDCLDDNWEPRIWEPLFGNQYWVAALPQFLETAPRADVKLLAEEFPELAKIVS